MRYSEAGDSTGVRGGGGRKAGSGLLPEHTGEGHDVSEAEMPKRDMEG